MNSVNLRVRYTQFFLIFLLTISLYITAFGLGNGISRFEKSFSYQGFLTFGFTQLKLVLGDRVFQQAIIGKQGWLEYTGEQNLDDYQNAIPIRPDALKITQQKIQKLYDALRKKNITLRIIVAPNKATIYPDRLFDEIQKINQTSNLDAFTAYMKEHGPAVLIDVTPALRNERKKQDVYYRTDTHWNSYGAFVAYTEIIKDLAKTYPELAAKDIHDFNIQIGNPQLLGIAKMMGATNILESGINFNYPQNDTQWTTLNEESKSSLQVATTPQKNLPTLLMYIDSFGIGMKNFMSHSFQKTTFIQIDSKYPDLLSPQAIDLINPNIVVIELAERFYSTQKLNVLLDQLTQGKKK